MKTKDAPLARGYATRLLRQALADPGRLTREKKFLKAEFFPVYLRRAESLVWHEPESALPFLQPAPEFAALLAEATPRRNGSDFLILAHSYLGNIYRRLSHTAEAQTQFDKAKAYVKCASPEALAKFYRYYAKLRIQQRRPEAFELLEKAITIYKAGNLVHRHHFGECLVTRGIAYYQFDQPEKTLDDCTAALNHLSLQVDPVAYYCALHNLATIAVRHGSDDDVRQAVDNLKPARSLLSGVNRHNYAKISVRWLFGLLSFRLGDLGDAELKLRDVAKVFRRLKLPFDLGCVQLDLARLYLSQGRLDKVSEVIRETGALFREIGNDAKVSQSLSIWRAAFTKTITDDRLIETRDRFFECKEPMAA